MHWAVIFDFDGVLVDSNTIKRNAFYQVFREYHDSKEIIDNIMMKKPELTRTGVITQVCEILASQNQVGDPARYIAEYTELTTNQVSEAPVIRGAKDALDVLLPKYDLFVNSRTPDDALTTILINRGLLKYFKKVYGADSGTKEYNCEAILKQGYDRDRTILVGDSQGDYNCANEVRIKFIGIGKTFSMNFENSLMDLKLLPSLIKDITKD